jgi:hypothetical protein
MSRGGINQPGEVNTRGDHSSAGEEFTIPTGETTSRDRVTYLSGGINQDHSQTWEINHLPGSTRGEYLSQVAATTSRGLNSSASGGYNH